MLDVGGISRKCQHRRSRVHRGETLDRHTDTAPAKFSLQKVRFAGLVSQAEDNILNKWFLGVLEEEILVQTLFSLSHSPSRRRTLQRASVSLRFSLFEPMNQKVKNPKATP